MSRSKLAELGIGWNPKTTIYMQAANGQLEQSLGMARNVPFCFGTLTVYLQVHVFEKPPYEVLLGRPFDTLTESVASSKRDGSVTITLHDPNSDEVVSVPTFERGKRKPLLQRNSKTGRDKLTPILPEGHRPKSPEPRVTQEELEGEQEEREGFLSTSRTGSKT